MKNCYDSSHIALCATAKFQGLLQLDTWAKLYLNFVLLLLDISCAILSELKAHSHKVLPDAGSPQFILKRVCCVLLYVI